MVNRFVAVGLSAASVIVATSLAGAPAAQAKQFCGAKVIGGFALIGLQAKGVDCAEGWTVVKAVEKRIKSYDDYVYAYRGWTCLTSRDELGFPKVKCSNRFDRLWWGHAP
jgi:hypothetical protein